jgi:hypothetical protein
VRRSLRLSVCCGDEEIANGFRNARGVSVKVILFICPRQGLPDSWKIAGGFRAGGGETPGGTGECALTPECALTAARLWGKVLRTMADTPLLRDFVYLDVHRVRSLAAQLRVGDGPGSLADRAALDRVTLEQKFAAVEGALPGALEITPDFNFDNWKQENFTDGKFIRAGGAIRLLDFEWLSMALGGLPAVLKKMSKIEMEALKNSEEGRKMSKSALQQRSLENQSAIAKVEEFKMGELNETVQKLYGDVVRVKIRPSKNEPRAVLIGSAYKEFFYDSPAALSQKYGVEVDAGWTVVGQVNAPNPSGPPQPIPVGNQMEDAFEQIALLMNNAFRLANAPAWPGVSFTPIAIYRTLK